jgi:hypothetical protein
MQDGDMMEVQLKKIRGRGRGETYSWSNSVDVCSGSFIEVYDARASGVGDGEGFGGLVGEALDHAAAGEGAVGDGRDDNLLYVSISASPFSLPCDASSFLFGGCEMGIAHRNTASIFNV